LDSRCPEIQRIGRRQQLTAAAQFHVIQPSDGSTVVRPRSLPELLVAPSDAALRRLSASGLQCRMSSPTVSALLTTYWPRSEWLRQAIESVIAQTFTDFELLVLDNSCLPSVRGIAESYGDERIQYLQGPGKGPGYNHAFGIAKAVAPLVAIINHDDAWEPTMLERLVEAYRSVPDAVLAFADHSVMDESGVIDPARSDTLSLQWKRTFLAPGVHQPFGEIALVDGSVALAQAAVFCRVIAADLDPRSGQFYDRDLLYRLACTGRPAVYVPERLAVWRESSSSLTSIRSMESALARLRMSWRFFCDPALADLRHPLRGELAHSARGVLGAGRFVARAKVRRVIRSAPR